MTRVAPSHPATAPAEVRQAAEAHEAAGRRLTNMKRTLLRSLPSFRALMTWYDLEASVRPFLGERLTLLFAHAVSSESDCLICSTYFRRILIERGEHPDRLTLDPREQAIVAYGRCLARAPFRVADETFAALRQWLDEEQVVALTAFGALMVATNIVNNALAIPLDAYLEPYRAVPA